MKYTAILRAHRKAQKVILFWGSSGFGKTSIVKAYCKEVGMKLLLRNAVYLDPLNTWLPMLDESRGVVVDRPHEWVHEVLTTSEPTVLFLDELSRARSVQIMNMMTELVLERTFNGRHISDHVQIVCASNLYEEDNGLVEIPDAVMNRMTHLTVAPDSVESAANMRTELGRLVIMQQPAVLRNPSFPELKLDGNPRQIDEIVDLWMTKELNENELREVARGRIGMEKGTAVAALIIDHDQKNQRKLPTVLKKEFFQQIGDCDRGGMGIEVVSLLRTTLEMVSEKSGGTKKTAVEKLIAEYLIQQATPETCRAMQSAKFYYEFPEQEMPLMANGKEVTNLLDETVLKPGMPVQYYLLAQLKLTDGFAAQSASKKS
jgi:hypothetical protein